MVKSDKLPSNFEEIFSTPDQLSLDAIATYCCNSEYGKLLPDAFYIHVFAIHTLDIQLQNYERQARCIVPLAEKATIVKFSTSKPKISYLFYPDFDTDPHPALHSSIQVNLETLTVNYRDYTETDNPPILHRKETFVTPEYPLYQQFAELTRAQDAVGLLNNTRGIGTKLGWEKRLQLYQVEIKGHSLIRTANNINSENLIPKIERHKAAIIRHDFSRPLRLALDADLFSLETTFFDYGCGHGGDMQRVSALGYSSHGWDPYYLPDSDFVSADIVNLGFVINVIENQGERRQALINAWKLTEKVLLVSAQVLISDHKKGIMAYGDGVITRRNTFQKYFEQEELKVYIDQVLGVDSVPIALGVYFVFRDQTQAELFRASRYRSRTTTPRIRACIQKFEEHQELLKPLMDFMSERGRVPTKSELVQAEEICQQFGSLRRAFQVIMKATDSDEWEDIADKRRQDLLVYLALCQFSHRPKLGELPQAIKEDILGLYSSYKQACLDADQMLRSTGNTELIIKRCQESKIGRKLPNSLWIHISALEAIDPLLRLYEGCASRTVGRLEEANVIKFHLKTPKISYLLYPNFDTEPHPSLYRLMSVDLRDLQVSYKEYDIDDDPPILHQLEQLVTPDYPQYEKFAKLTRQEEDWGLLEDLRSVSHLSSWNKCLQENCASLHGYKLFWSKDADSYKLKVLKAAMLTRKRQRQKVNSSH